jgi:hypothetical protein
MKNNRFIPVIKLHNLAVNQHKIIWHISNDEISVISIKPSYNFYVCGGAFSAITGIHTQADPKNPTKANITVQIGGGFVGPKAPNIPASPIIPVQNSKSEITSKE